MEKEEERYRANHDVSLGDLSALFESLQGRVVVELLIELVNVVVGLSMGLNIHRVVLNTFRRRHDGARRKGN